MIAAHLPAEVPGRRRGPRVRPLRRIVAGRNPHPSEVLPRRCIVERTFAWISKHRRTTRHYERLPASHEAMIVWP